MQLGIVPCRQCPRLCGADRQTARGFCGAPATPGVSAICLHHGEEPPLSDGGGIVNIFFAHCNLHCLYCQNGDISGRTVDEALVHYRDVDAIAERVCHLLPQGNGLMGFVTAAHYADLLPDIVAAIHRRGLTPTVVYNSSGYESIATLRRLEGCVDIYLPDLKYMDTAIAARYSHAPDYPDVAAAALMEMKRQVGAGLKCDDDGRAFRGLIVRHLVLPGHTDNSLRCMEWLADHFPAPTLHLSLMAQYFPPRPGLPSPIDRTLTAAEYAVVARHFEDLGFDGWLQELSAEQSYRPDFANAINPFTI